MGDISYELSDQLLALRTRAALTQIALATELGVHRRSVQNWEAGLSYPRAELLQRLIAVFLRHGALMGSDDLAEARALWEQAAANSSYAFPTFDPTWFAHALAHPRSVPAAGLREAGQAQVREVGAQGAHAAQPEPPLTIIDWGGLLAVPTLVGRDDELRTLHQWVLKERCNVVTLLGIGGIGKSSLAVAFAHQALPHFERVLFHTLQNGPPLAELLDQTIRAIDPAPMPHRPNSDKIALLVQLLRERRCLLVLDSFEAILEPGALSGTYRSGYTAYAALLEALSARAHQSCLLLTSREKPTELGRLEGRAAPVRTLEVAGLEEGACGKILEARDIFGQVGEVSALVQMYGGNPLALQLVATALRELFGRDIGTFLATGDAFFNGVGTLMARQCARSTPLERAIMRWLALEREPLPVNMLLTRLSDVARPGEILTALESLRRRAQVERDPHQAVFSLQPVIREFLTDQLVGLVADEIVAGQPQLLESHALVQPAARTLVQHSQERLIGEPLLGRLRLAYGGAEAAESRLLTLLEHWRGQPPRVQGYGPGNVLNLLRLLRGHLRDIDLSGLTIR